jgi:superfamily II DNA or RNA helicase
MPRATIEISHPTIARVVGVPFEALSELDELLAIENPAAEHIRRQARMRGNHWAAEWDGKTHLFKADTGTFPTGMLQRVQKALKKAKYKVRVKDTRPCVEEAPKALQRVSEGMLKGVKLRDYQLDAIRSGLEHRGGICQLATNAGKTAVGAGYIEALGRPITLYMVPNRKLVAQAKRDLAGFLGMQPDDIGVIQGGKFEPKQITIAITNSLLPRSAAKRKAINKYLKTVQHLILDEVHHAAAKTWMQVVKKCSAYWRFGLSGTPFDRSDGRSAYVEAYCGPAVARVTNKELIQRGFSAKPKIRLKSISKVIDYHDNEVNLDGTYDEVYKAGIVRNKYFHERIVRDALKHVAKGRPTFILIREYEHGFALMDRFEEHGFGRVEFVHGKMSEEDIEDAKKRFADGETQILIVSPVFGEGQSIPEIRGLVIGDDFKSVILTLQRIGRGLRKKKGDNTLHMTEYAHFTHRYLTEHSDIRVRRYEKEGFEVW